MKHLTTAALVAALASCVSSEPTAERHVRIFELEPWHLNTDLVPAPDRGKLIDQELRYLIDQVRPQIAACLTTGPRATVDLEIVLAVEPDGPATIVSTTATVEPSAETLADTSCVDDALSEIDTASLTRPERAESWTVHTSLYTGAP